ncbi:MAG: hypothetical protein EA368_11510 [Leptolyngbya sp. DLM2.Bin27]|nr:MAG: hypothetical protein EA368_11510 [Leptolyngbya sp. DLM2.Bin27]
MGVSLGLVAASSLWTVAQAYPVQEEVLATPLLIQVDEIQVDELTDELAAAESLHEPLAEMTPTVSEADLAATLAVDTLVAEVAPVPTEVLANLSPDQRDAIAAILQTAEEAARTNTLASLPTEVLTQLDALGVGQQAGRRRWLPTNVVRRLRLPQMVTSLIRQPKNTALVMLGNHIVVVNPVTGAILGAVLSAL